jgi:hypothetical protein
MNENRLLAFRPYLRLLGVLITVCAVMEVVIFALVPILPGMQDSSTASTVLIRCSLVLASAVVLFLIARSAARGSRGNWIRLRIISVVVVAAVVVIISIPGLLPWWARIEQGVCGGLVLPLAIFVNMARTAALFPKDVGSATADA